MTYIHPLYIPNGDDFLTVRNFLMCPEPTSTILFLGVSMKLTYHRALSQVNIIHAAAYCKIHTHYHHPETSFTAIGGV